MRILNVSNRLTITVVEKGDKLKFQKNARGFVSGLSAYLDSLKSSSFTKSEYIWIGLSGITVDNRMREELTSRALSEFYAYWLHYKSVNLRSAIFEIFSHLPKRPSTNVTVIEGHQ
jgi:hypothetical protein